MEIRRPFDTSDALLRINSTLICGVYPEPEEGPDKLEVNYEYHLENEKKTFITRLCLVVALILPISGQAAFWNPFKKLQPYVETAKSISVCGGMGAIAGAMATLYGFASSDVNISNHKTPAALVIGFCAFCGGLVGYIKNYLEDIKKDATKAKKYANGARRYAKKARDIANKTKKENKKDLENIKEEQREHKFLLNEINDAIKN